MAELRKPSSVIRFNPLNGQLERPTLLLTTRSGNVIGELQYENLNLSFVGKGLNEISFDVHKSVNGKECSFWDKIKDLCIVDFKDFGRFEAHVTTDDSNETIKTFTCESLETELGQRLLYEFHVNTDEAITLSDGTFTPTVLCNFNDTEHSLLHRALKDKAPHWSIHEDDVSRLFNVNGRVYNRESIQRTFSVDGTSIYDFFEGDVSQECCCVFTYDTYERRIGCHNLQECVYDKRTMEALNNYYSIDGVEFYEIINNNDGSRTERKLTDEEVSTNHLAYLRGIGEDTSIFVSKNKLSRSFTIDSDKGSIKNCFRVTGGDDVITNIVASANVSGNNYIYIFGNFQYEDMSDELVAKIKSYAQMVEYSEKEFTADGGVYILDTTCEYRDGICYNENGIVLPTALNDGTNVFILDPLAYYKNGKAYDKDGELLPTNQYMYKDSAGLYTQYCQLLDRISYIEHSKFPNTSHDTTAEKEKTKILNYFSSNNVVSRTRWSHDSYSHVRGNIEDMISVVCDNRYEIKMLSGTDYPESCTFTYNEETKEGSGTWKGFVEITRELDETDTREFELTVGLRLAYNEGDLEFCRQKIDVAIASMDIVNLDFKSFNTIGQANLVAEDGVKNVNVYIDLADLLRKINFTSVSSYVECFSSCRDVLDDLYSNLGITEENINLESDAIVISRERYTIRYNTALVVKQEIEKKLNELKSELESINKQIVEFRNNLDMSTYFGDDLWLEFQSYVREDEYNNSNYISDGLSDSEIMAKCKELLQVAKEELSSACNIQYQISGDLNNIFAIQDLKQLHDKFAIFNYIRCRADDKIYKLRLMQIDFSDSSPESIGVTFSEQIERIDGKVSDQESIMNSMQSISSSYNSTTKQAKQGATALNTFSTMREEGLNSSLYVVKNNRTTTTFGDTGIHCKSVLDSGIFSDCMLNVNSNGIYMTDNAWESVKTAIGKFKFNGEWVYGVNTELLIGNMIVGENLLISNQNQNGESSVQIDGNGITIKNGLIQSSNYKVGVSGSMLDLDKGTFDFAGGKLTYSENKLKVDGEVVTKSGQIGNWTIGNAIYNGTNSATSTAVGTYIGTDAIRQYSSDNSYIHMQNGKLTCNNIDIKGGELNINNRFKVSSNGDVTLPDNATISWENVDNQPTIPSKTSDLTNDSGYQNASQVTTEATRITNNTIETGNLVAQNLRVNAANINGILAASQIESGTIHAGSVNAENIYGTTITGKTISGGSVVGAEISATNSFKMRFTSSLINYGNATANAYYDEVISTSKELMPPEGFISMGVTTVILGNQNNYSAIYGQPYMFDGSVLHSIPYSLNSSLGCISYFTLASNTSKGTYIHCQCFLKAYGITIWESDTKLKENIKETEQTSLDKINQLEFIQFDWKKNDGHVDLGLSANQVEEVIPSAVFEVEQGEDSEYDTLKNIDTPTLTTYSLKAIQEMSKIIENQQSEIDSLKESISFLMQQNNQEQN